MIMTMAADSSSDTKRSLFNDFLHYSSFKTQDKSSADTCIPYFRSKTFCMIFSALLFTELLGPPIAYWTMKKALWSSYLFCALALAVSFPILLAMPETLKLKTEDDDGLVPNSESCSHGLPSIRVYRKFFTDWRIVLGLSSMFMAQFRTLTVDILLPYAPSGLGGNSVRHVVPFLNTLAQV